MDKIYDVESAPARQNRVITNVKKISLTRGQPRDVEVLYMTALMRVGNPQRAGHSSVQALTPKQQQ